MATEEENTSFNEGEETELRRPHKGGRVLRLEPTNTMELLASPLTVTSFKHVGYDFCEKIRRVQHHPMLTRLFISRLHENQVTLAGVTFSLSTAIISAAIEIPNVGEK